MSPIPKQSYLCVCHSFAYGTSSQIGENFLYEVYRFVSEVFLFSSLLTSLSSELPGILDNFSVLWSFHKGSLTSVSPAFDSFETNPA